MSDLDSLRFGDLVTLLAVRRQASITGAARALRVTPSQVSKAVTRLERHFRARLVSRGAKGVSFTAAGLQVLPRAEEVVDRLEATRAGVETLPLVTVAAPTWISQAFLPGIAFRLEQEGVRVRGIELAPALIRTFLVDGSFDFAITTDPPLLTKTWSSTPVGEVRHALYGSPEVARSLGKGPVDPAALQAHEFVSPVNMLNGQVVRVDDRCPLGSARRRGHEAYNFASALELIARTRQLAFGPSIAARKAVERGAVVEIPVRGWDVCERLHVSCSETVLSRLRREVVSQVSTELGALARA